MSTWPNNSFAPAMARTCVGSSGRFWQIPALLRFPIAIRMFLESFYHSKLDCPRRNGQPVKTLLAEPDYGAI